MTAMQPIGYDIDVPSLASVVGKFNHRARYRFQKHSYSDWIMQRGSLHEAIDLAVGMGEKNKKVVEHLSEIDRRRRGILRERSFQQRLLDLSCRQDLMGEIERDQGSLVRKRPVREDRFCGFGIALLNRQIPTHLR